MKTSISSRSFVGFVFVAAAVLILLFNTGVITELAWRPVLLSWQMLILVIGIFNLINRNYHTGIITTFLGVLFLVPKVLPLTGIDYQSSSVTSIMWTVAFIVLGLWLMFGHKVLKNNSYGMHYHKRIDGNHSSATVDCSEEGAIDYNLMMNGVDEIFLKPVFRGGKISTMMGGVKLDLRKTTLPEGDTKLKIESMWGGVTLIVPESWNIEIHSSSILGGFSDNRATSNVTKDNDRKLIIDASFLMGGGDIRC